MSARRWVGSHIVSPHLQMEDWEAARASRVTMLKHGANGDIGAWSVHIGVNPLHKPWR